ncbi:hypothetical protein HS088_TW08G00258 [Tripterygium wilfordii]|uniref:SAUR-like auxin-responsive protein family n=1 Tax=Tripterygium wilfordii TaxID=458696 RepID=A0A7J7DBF7_TRIWF|nr:auxin-responsive protein SAUR71-like [Tripterygium wilfordii]KAF5743673.1 hypothetical protein HS088_TW08G00258 [Tripterygium wilfordii]
MDIMKGKWKKIAVSKALERCRSLSLSREEDKKKTKKRKVEVAPEGCFAVYVGAEKQRFIIKTEFANHPLFKMLLENAESEYGYDSSGPILIPCNVDLFYKVLAEMNNCDDDDEDDGQISQYIGCGYGAVLCMSPSRRGSSTKGCGGGGYRLLSPSRMLKLNGF